MKVFFAASTSQFDKYFPIYKQICSTIKSRGHTLTRDWIDEAKEVLEKDLRVDYEEMYEDIMASILYADVGIVEGTVKGLSTGHQMTISLQKGKPLLFLHQGSGEDKFPFIVQGVHSELFVDKQYKDPSEIPALIKEFLELNKRGKKVRFNLVLTAKEEKYVEWASFVYKKTKTDIIRELITARMETDLNYKKANKK